MPETLPVHINREDLHSVEVPDSFETTGSFDIDLQNHGEALHVHLHLDDALSTVASIDAGNHYVDREGERRVRVNVNGSVSPPVHGKLKVVSAYGAQTRYVDVDYVAPPEEKHEVEVDESLGKPQPKVQNQTRSSGVVQPELLVLFLGILAIVAALVATLVIDSTAVLLGSLAVLGGVIVAMYMLFQE